MAVQPERTGPGQIESRIEGILSECFEADDPSAALSKKCEAFPEHADVLRNRFAMAAGLGLIETVDDGRRVGDFRLIHELGRGGMGVVWLAEQESLGRRVALKLMRASLSGDVLAQRLKKEAAILGQMNHRGIAHVYETGVVEVAPGVEQPYFAMEFVDGFDLTRHVKTRELDTRSRLELFVKVCDGVAHAHDHGVVHRDLKPENILVDASGDPRILDFGIARVLEPELTSSALQTATGQVLGTLPYMSPEQVCGNTEEVDERSDVFALGSILYELLCGHVPIDLEQDAIVEAARRIVEEDAPRLGRVETRFRGDLETIVDKALRKEKELRYPSAAALAADIRRFLADEPIVARPPTTIYYLRKFARRNRPVLLGLTAAVVGAVAAALFAMRANEKAAVASSLSDAATRLSNRTHLVGAENALRTFDPIGARHRLDRHEGRTWEWLHLMSRLDDRVDDIHFPSAGEVFAVAIPRASGFGIRVRDATGDRYRRWTPESGLTESNLEATSPTDHRLQEHRGELPEGNVWVSWAGPDLICGAAKTRAFVYDVTRPGSLRYLPGETSGLFYVRGHAATGRIVTAGGDGALRLYDARTTELLATEHRVTNKRMYKLEFFPDGSSIGMAGWDGTMRIFDAETLSPQRVLLGDGRKLAHICISSDGRYVASRPFGYGRQWFVWSAGREDPRILRGHSSYVYAVAVHPDGKRVASGGWLGNSEAEWLEWDLDRRTAVAKPSRSKTSNICALAYSPDGTHLATLDDTRHLRLWDVTDSKHELVASRNAYPGNKYGPLTFAPDSRRILWPVDASPKLWDWKRDRVEPVSHLRQLTTGHASPRGDWFATHDGSTQLRCQLTDRSRTPTSIAIEGDYRSFTWLDHAEHGSLLLVPRCPIPKPTGRSVAHDAAVVDPRSGAELARLTHGSELFGIAVSPEGERIATGTRDGMIHIWDARVFEPVVQLSGHRAYVFALSWSPDSSTLVSGSGDRTVRIWDTQSMREIVQKMRAH